MKPQIRKQKRKIKAIKIWFFKKKISTQAKGEKKMRVYKILDIRDKNWVIATNSMKIKRTIRLLYEQIYVHITFDTLIKMNQC